MTSFLLEYDVTFAWIWHHFCLNMTSLLLEYDIIFAWIWRHFCLNMTSLLLEYDITFAWIWRHFCLNMTSFLSGYLEKIEPDSFIMRFSWGTSYFENVMLHILIWVWGRRNLFSEQVPKSQRSYEKCYCPYAINTGFWYLEIRWLECRLFVELTLIKKYE